MKCRSCSEGRSPDRLLSVACNIHPAGDRNCLCPFYVCRPSVEGNRPDCIRKSVMGADVHRLLVS